MNKYSKYELDTFLNDIDALCHNTLGDESAADFIEAANKAIQIITKYRDEAQSEINNVMDDIAANFGGDVTLRQLKGE